MRFRSIRHLPGVRGRRQQPRHRAGAARGDDRESSLRPAVGAHEKNPYIVRGLIDMTVRLSIACAVMVFSATSVVAQTNASRATRFVDSLVARMTLEEKLGQLTQLPGRWGDTGPTVP